MLTLPIIFLDFDGVLNTNQWIWDHSERGFEHIDPERVTFLNQLVDRSDALVVVSSAWRILYPLNELREGLAAKGFTGEIVSTTDNNGSVRGFQIQRWRETHNHTGPFVILDDSSDMAHLMPWLVKTSADHGLTGYEVKQALHILRNQPE